MALQDDNFNNNCPQAPREAYFKQNCPGQFKPAKKSYTFMEKGICGTGRQIFDTDKALCTALQNDKLNQDCARPERESYFKLLQCKGKFNDGKSADNSGFSGNGGDLNPDGETVLSNLDCKGYYISDNGKSSSVNNISWSARDLKENVFPDMPDHSSIVLTCTKVSGN